MPRTAPARQRLHLAGGLPPRRSRPSFVPTTEVMSGSFTILTRGEGPQRLHQVLTVQTQAHADDHRHQAADVRHHAGTAPAAAADLTAAGRRAFRPRRGRHPRPGAVSPQTSGGTVPFAFVVRRGAATTRFDTAARHRSRRRSSLPPRRRLRGRFRDRPRVVNRRHHTATRGVGWGPHAHASRACRPSGRRARTAPELPDHRPARGSWAGANDVDKGTTSIQLPRSLPPTVNLTSSFAYYSPTWQPSADDFFRVGVVGPGKHAVFEERPAAMDAAATAAQSVDDRLRGPDDPASGSVADWVAGASTVEAGADSVVIIRR